jgi:predicted nucleotide-binding protein
MQKEITYYEMKFDQETIQGAFNILLSFLDDEQRQEIDSSRRIKLIEAEKWVAWRHDTDEEFFADYRKDHHDSYYYKSVLGFGLTVNLWERQTSIEVKAPDRKKIEAIFEVFEKNEKNCKLPPLQEKQKPRPGVFIGHGRSGQWKDLKDHLHEKHGYDVEAYETGARAGHEIRDILEKMMNKVSFAILVMTGEDEVEGGKMRARQNVVHELGLFQGHLGFTKAIVLLEEGTEAFSNLNGVQQIRYGKENIKETFGEVLATLRREGYRN